MIEIIVMIGVIAWFGSTANDMGENRFVWGFVGAISYFIPVILFGYFIYPLIIASYITQQNRFGFTILGVILSICIGASSCFLISRLLLSKESSE